MVCRNDKFDDLPSESLPGGVMPIYLHLLEQMYDFGSFLEFLLTLLGHFSVHSQRVTAVLPLCNSIDMQMHHHHQHNHHHFIGL